MDTVLSTDTPNAGRVKWNSNDSELQGNINTVSAALTTHKSSSDHDSRYYTETEIDAQQAAQDAALNTHKSSGDHDSRYYTETEIDAQQAAQDAALNTHKSSGDHDARYVQLSGNQGVAGIKTFTDNPVVKNANPGIEYQDAAGTQLARVRGGSSSGAAVFKAEVFENGSFNAFLQCVANDGKVDFNRDVYASGERLASEKYVQTRIRSGFFAMVLEKAATTTASTVVRLGETSGSVIPVPSGARLISLIYLQSLDDEQSASAYEGTVSVLFSSAYYRFLRADVEMGLNVSGFVFPTLRVYAGRIVSHQIIWTEIASIQTPQDIGLPVNDSCRFHLTAGFSV
jgi:hypothetical protein